MESVFILLIPSKFSELRKSWMEVWSFRFFRIQMTVSLLFLFFLSVFIPYFFSYIQSIKGYAIDDFILNQFQVRDMSLYIFILNYAVLFLTIINLIPKPILFLKCLQAYCLLVVMRVVCMYCLPLDPDRYIIPLEDPFVGRFFYSGYVITKDLFFSGHVSTMFLFFLAIPVRLLKYIFFAATLLVAIFILIQHVHYSIDIIAAPLFSWICYRLVHSIPLGTIKTSNQVST